MPDEETPAQPPAESEPPSTGGSPPDEIDIQQFDGTLTRSAPEPGDEETR